MNKSIEMRKSWQLPGNFSWAGMAMILIVGTILSACSTTIKMPQTPGMQAYDKETEYKITPQSNGFLINLNHSKYQYMPEMDVVVDKCKNAVVAVAHEYADEEHRKIKPIMSERIKYTSDRNFSGITSC